MERPRKKERGYELCTNGFRPVRTSCDEEHKILIKNRKEHQK